MGPRRALGNPWLLSPINSIIADSHGHWRTYTDPSATLGKPLASGVMVYERHAS
jgi:hypothetical protein